MKAKKTKPVKITDGGEIENPSSDKEAFRALIETYKTLNPVKYEMKKEALEAQLKAL